MDFVQEADVKPIYPTPAYIGALLSDSRPSASTSAVASIAPLTDAQKFDLVKHSTTRSCAFGDITTLSYLLTDPVARKFVDIHHHDDDGLGLVSITILGFGAETERDVEREECVRLLVTHNADLSADHAGWTPLHYSVLASPASLVSYLMTHGCSPFAETRRKLTPLDIVTGHTTLPGREDVVLILSETMRSEGWKGSRMDQKRKLLEERIAKRKRTQFHRESIAKILGVDHGWWKKPEFDGESDEESDIDESEVQDHIFTPTVDDYSSQLVFSPERLPEIFESLIVNFPTVVPNASPANSLYLLARFAAINCDDLWLEDLILGAADVIEETIFNRSDDVTCLVFWLYNTTTWLHLCQCDKVIHEPCDNMGLFELIEEIINSIFVFIIRFAERRIDQQLDEAFLEYLALPADLDSIEFESDWSFLRPFASLKKSNSNTTPISSPRKIPSPTKPSIPIPTTPTLTPASPSFADSIRQSISRARGDTPAPETSKSAPSPSDVISFLTALHTLLTDADINPAFITQFWSQVMFWTSCEIFNRVLTRKKYLCRSRAIQIGMNVGFLEEWVEQMNLPRGVQSHLLPVRDLLHWLQSLSAVQEFPDLIATVQTLKHLNPLQMRRAVKDYKYEVNEPHMPDECSQYLEQLQKDWERHRVHRGKEILRKEITDSASVSSLAPNRPESSLSFSSTIAISEADAAQQDIDLLFDRNKEKSAWKPIKAPPVLGELLDSRHMLPLLLPSDPKFLSATPARLKSPDDSRLGGPRDGGRSGAMTWYQKARQIRNVPADVLQWVDGARSASRWGRPVNADDDSESEHDHHDPKEKQLPQTPADISLETVDGNVDEFGLTTNREVIFTTNSASNRVRTKRPSLVTAS